MRVVTAAFMFQMSTTAIGLQSYIRWGFRVHVGLQGSGFRVQGAGFRVQGSGFSVVGFGV